MEELSDEVPIPPKNLMNVNLSPALESTMLKVLGNPGILSKDCSDPTGNIAKLIKLDFNVGPFKVDGLNYAVESLLQLFTEVKNERPDIYQEVKNTGMLCVRHRRRNPTLFSNHSWGASIDIFFGSRVVDQGRHVTHRGNLLLAPYFQKYGWYWGAEFSGESVDSMHFELADETILKLQII